MIKSAEEYPDELKEKEQELSQQDDFSEIPPSDIVAFNELRSCSDLARMHKAKQIDINPDFQRDIVWPNTNQTRFVDSLVKQLPIPSMCISLDYKTDKRLMIDGLQRINTIIKFLTDDDWRLSSLDDVEESISGKTPLRIREEHPAVYSRIENLTIPITVLRCDNSKINHMNYLFTIFHRLNTGGSKLTNQEIRNCIYQGNFNKLLKSFVAYPNFRKLFDLEDEMTYRFAYEELILRFIALYDTYDSYKGRLAKYLNDYMYNNRDIQERDLKEKKGFPFTRVVDLVYSKLCDNETMSNLSKAISEALFVGIGKNIDKLEKEDKDALSRRFQRLIDDDKFSGDSLKGGLSDKNAVIGRINRAIEIFQ